MKANWIGDMIAGIRGFNMFIKVLEITLQTKLQRLVGWKWHDISRDLTLSNKAF